MSESKPNPKPSEAPVKPLPQPTSNPDMQHRSGDSRKPRDK